MGPSGSRSVPRALALAAAVLVATTSAVIWRHYRADMGEARQRVSESQLVQTPCGPVEYSIVGEGPPVLVIHGAGGGFDQ